MISKAMDSIIAERYKNGRQWKLNYPERLLEGILSQTKNDYIAAKVKLIRKGYNYPLEDYEEKCEKLKMLDKRIKVLIAYHEELVGESYLETEVDEIAKRIKSVNAELAEVREDRKHTNTILHLHDTCRDCQRFVWHIGKSIATQVFASWERAVEKKLEEPEPKKSVITEEMIQEIIYSPLSGGKLAKKMGISQDTVSRYRREYRK